MTTFDVQQRIYREMFHEDQPSKNEVKVEKPAKQEVVKDHQICLSLAGDNCNLNTLRIRQERLKKALDDGYEIISAIPMVTNGVGEVEYILRKDNSKEIEQTDIEVLKDKIETLEKEVNNLNQYVSGIINFIDFNK